MTALLQLKNFTPKTLQNILSLGETDAEFYAVLQHKYLTK